MATWKQVLVGRPWWHSPVLWIAIIAVLAISGVLTANFTVWNNPAVPSFPSLQGEIEQPVAQPVQPEPVVVAPVVVDYRVVWTEVRGFDPSTIPVEEGFYNGTFPTTGSWSPSNPNDIPEGDTYAWKVLPHLKEVGRGTIVAATRDHVNKDVVMVSIEPAARYQPYLLLSVDGEKSWCMLNLLPVYWGGYQQGIVNDPRIVAQGEEIHLYGQDARPGYHWWETVVKKSELPCS